MDRTFFFNGGQRCVWRREQKLSQRGGAHRHHERVVHLVALELDEDSGAIGTTQQERSSTVGVLTLHQMDDRADHSGGKK